MNLLKLDVDAALVRLLNIGIFLAFKSLLTEALNETLEKRLPYLMLSAEDFSKNYGEQKFEIVGLFLRLYLGGSLSSKNSILRKSWMNKSACLHGRAQKKTRGRDKNQGVYIFLTIKFLRRGRYF